MPRDQATSSHRKVDRVTERVPLSDDEDDGVAGNGATSSKKKALHEILEENGKRACRMRHVRIFTELP